MRRVCVEITHLAYGQLSIRSHFHVLIIAFCLFFSSFCLRFFFFRSIIWIFYRVEMKKKRKEQRNENKMIVWKAKNVKWDESKIRSAIVKSIYIIKSTWAKYKRKSEIDHSTMIGHFMDCNVSLFIVSQTNGRNENPFIDFCFVFGFFFFVIFILSLNKSLSIDPVVDLASTDPKIHQIG